MKRLLLIAMAFIMVMSVSACSNSSGSDVKPTEEATEKVSYPYQIFNTEDTSFGNLKRKTVYASIPEEYYKSCDDETLGKIVEQVALEDRKSVV